MRKSQQPLLSIRSLDTYGTRHLGTRGAIPRDLTMLELVSPRQSMRSSIGHYSYPRVTKISTAKRWLRQQAGRFWNDVYSELRAQYKTQQNVADIALESLLSQVERNVFLSEDGQLKARDAYNTYAVNGLYVNPTTGVLEYLDGHENAANQRKFHKQQREARKAQARVIVSASQQLHKLDNLWFWVELAPITAPQHRIHPDYVYRDGTVSKGWVETLSHTLCVDILTGRQFMTVPTAYWETRDLVDSYGTSTMYAKSKRQASREDVKRHVVQEPLAA